LTPRKLGHYDILQKLGEGGMGQVFRGKDARLNRSVAIKILPPDVAGDPVRRDRFEQEARSLGALNHPNIVAVYDVGQSDGQAYLVSELLDGESLRAMIERGPVSTKKLLDYATQIADGLAAAHALGIVHRDLKPENVMLSRDGRVKILDFGLAKQSAPRATEETATIALSQPGMVLGTVGYMSPEQVRAEAVDARSDIFSFGCVLYEMASGKQPFTGKSAADVMSAVLREDPPEIDSTLPPALAAIVRRCLEKDPARRFQSAADLAFALRSVGHLTTSGSGTPRVQGARRRIWRPIVVGTAALLVFAAGYLLHRPSAATVSDFQRLTFREGHVTNARFTPDRQNFVYSAEWDGEPARLYIGTPGSPESRALDAPPASRLLAVSSKGDLALLTGPFSPNGTGTVARVSLSGGQPRPLLENVRFADWSPDGSELAVVRLVNGTSRLEYPVGKVLLESEWLRAGIRVSPDGQRVAVGSFANGTAIQILIVDRSGTVQRFGAVSGQVGEPGSVELNWTADGHEIWFQSFDGATRNTIYALDRKGGRRVVARYPARVSLYDLAADGRMLVGNESGRVGIRGAAPGDTAERDLSCLESSMLRDITPDGRMILVNIAGESGGPKGSIYWRMTDGAPPVRLGDGNAFAISPDGKWVTGYSARDVKDRKYILMPTGPGEEWSTSFANLPHQFGLVVGWLAGDGNYLVSGLTEGKKAMFYAWNRPSNQIRPASDEGVEDSMPLISPDRRQFLALHATHGWEICTVDTAACAPVPGLSAHDQPLGWRADGRSFYATTHHDENRKFVVSIVDIATGRRSEWRTIQPSILADSVSSLKITPDGRAYAYNYSYLRSDLYLTR
jgi:serine/threonine protein kinase/Tol biopolymer transport system component